MFPLNVPACQETSEEGFIMSDLERAIKDLTEQTERMLRLERESYDNLLKAATALQLSSLCVDSMLLKQKRNAG